MTPQEMINVIQAFKNGKQIESKLKNNTSKDWVYVDKPMWDFYLQEYRIKPKQTKELYKYLLKNPNISNPYYESPYYYSNNQEALETYKETNAIIIKRLDHTKITVEE